MESKGCVVEFLCTRCGLQGLLVIESGPGDGIEATCPRCGSKAITPHSKEKASVLSAY